MKKINFSILSTLLFANTVLASSLDTNGFGIGAKVSTLGIGVELIKPMNNIDWRIGYNNYDLNLNQTIDGTDYNANLKLQSLAAIANWHPMGNGFFMSGGAVSTDNKLDATATANLQDPILIGDTKITQGTVKADIKFNEVAPYVGIGYRQQANKSQGWGFSYEAGILLQQNPSISLSESTGLVSQADLNKEIEKARDDINKLKSIPVLSIGAHYNFQ